MNSVLWLMRLCLLNIGRPDRRGLCSWRIDDYWPLGRAIEVGAGTSVLLLSAKGLLSASVWPKHSLLPLLTQDCGLLWKIEYLLQFNVFAIPLVASPDRPLSPRGPSQAFILLAVCFWRSHPVLVRNAASSQILFSPGTPRGCQMASQSVIHRTHAQTSEVTASR